MLPPRACKSQQSLPHLSLPYLPFYSDFFIGLNAVRILSIVALLLVFASNISTLVKDIKAVNAFMEAGKAAATGAASNATLEELQDFDYITYVPLSFQIQSHCANRFLRITVEARCLINPPVPSGRSSTDSSSSVKPLFSSCQKSGGRPSSSAPTSQCLERTLASVRSVSFRC